ncbi:MAG: peroxiredoxin family protein [Gammaproteobacteria bacterium]|nr:peroxiredoxin family protein [Gammaproteobacteria bacterium]
MKVRTGDRARDFTLLDMQGNPCSLSDYKGNKILLSFYRDAGCPFCNLRIFELTRRQAGYEKQGLVMLALFKSNYDGIRRYVGRQNRSFPMLADPEGKVYDIYGVESSWPSLLLAFFRIPRILKAFSKGFLPTLGAFKPLLPADILINSDLTVAKAFYARDAASHISLKDIETFLSK